MEILYISPKGKKKEPDKNGKEIIYDFKLTAEIISSSIEKNISETQVSMVADIISKGDELDDSFHKYDLYICDLTTMNPNILFQAGRAEGLNKPIIYRG